MTIKHVRMWCPNCDAAIISGTSCPVCQTDVNRNLQDKQQKKKNKQIRKVLLNTYNDPQLDD
jgi:hypothetical protein